MKESSFLVGDAGGTGTQWRLVQGGEVSQFATVGFNAYTHDISAFGSDIRAKIVPDLDTVDQFFLYAAGVDTPQQREEVTNYLSTVFGKMPEVENDLLGVSRALCGKESGNVCILGTGANACYYDGENVDKVGASLGYILGDEGSGAHLGKRLLASVFRKRISSEIVDAFQNQYALTSHTAIETLYNKPMPNHYLASFSKFLGTHKNHRDIYNLIYDSFKDYFKAFYPNGNQRDLPFYFSGSIAFYFSDILRQVAADLSLPVKNIIESPIAGLLLYHKNHG